MNIFRLQNTNFSWQWLILSSDLTGILNNEYQIIKLRMWLIGYVMICKLILFYVSFALAPRKQLVGTWINKDLAYFSKGLTSWKKIPKCFAKHEQSKTHITSKTYKLVVLRCANVDDMLLETLSRKYFIKIPSFGSSDNNHNPSIVPIYGNYSWIARIDVLSLSWLYQAESRTRQVYVNTSTLMPTINVSCLR